MPQLISMPRFRPVIRVFVSSTFSDLKPERKPQVITGADARVGMQGMGGIGKSVLAAALARNSQVRQSYPDGVVWISCGQKLNDDDLLKRQRDLARHLGGD